MQRIILGLVIAGLGSSAFCQNEANFWVGSYGLTGTRLQATILREGTVLERSAHGFFHVRLHMGSSPDSLRFALGIAGVKYSVPCSAENVDEDSLQSVRDHIRFLQGAYEIETGEDPEYAHVPGVDSYQMLEDLLARQIDPKTGRVDALKLLRAIRHRDAMKQATAAMLDPGAVKGSLAPIQWVYWGPHKLAPTVQTGMGLPAMSGRKYFVTQAPSEPSKVFVATSGGGLWTSSDSGQSFVPKSDKWPALTTGCVTVDPVDPNIIYVGTGNTRGTGFTSAYGIMKSTDGGQTWTNVGASTFLTAHIKRILISKLDRNVVFALATGTGVGDIYKSTDAGVTWARTSAHNDNWNDIESSPDGSVLLAGGFNYISKSTDQGETWTDINAFIAGGTVWDVAISKVDPLRYYVISTSGQFRTSVDGGITWTDRKTELNNALAGTANAWSVVNPSVVCGYSGANDIVIVGNQTVLGSDDNGLTWNDLTRSLSANALNHAGQRYVAPKIDDPQSFWIASDGGLMSAHYDVATHSFDVTERLNDTIGDTELTGLSVHPTNPYVTLAGSNDLGIIAQRGAINGQPWISIDRYSPTRMAFDLANPTKQYVLTGGQVQLLDGMNSTTPTILGTFSLAKTLVCGGPTGSIPIVGDNGGNLRVLTGGTWETRSTGTTSAIRALVRSKFSNDKLFLSGGNGELFRTLDSGASFTRIEGNLPIEDRTAIGEAGSQPDKLLVGSSYSATGDVVFGCDNVNVANPVWTNRTGSGATRLPDTWVNDIEIDDFNDVAYAATNVGLFVSPDFGANWYSMSGMGFPNVPVLDMQIYRNGPSNYLYVTTYGRGMWRCLLSTRTLNQVIVNKPEIYGGQQNTFTLKLSGAAPAGCLVKISDNSASVSVPTGVLIPAGTAQATFTSFSVNPAATEVVTVTGSIYGTSATGNFTLHHIPNFTLTPESANVYGGNRFSATIDMGAPTPITAVFTFTDDAVEVSSPSSTSIAQGEQTKVVPYYTLAVAAPLTATIGARLANTIGSSTVTLQPRPDLQAMEVNPSSIVGGTNTTGKAVMTVIGAAGAQTVTVSDSSSVVTTPPNVIIPPGASEGTFNIATNPVSSSVNVLVKGNLRGITKTVTLNVHP